MPRTYKKSQITYKTIVPMKKSVQEPKKTQSRFGIWIVPRQWGCDTMTCTRLAGMILWCQEVQDAISSLAPADIYIVSVTATATPWLFLATLSNWSTFNIDLSALVENQQLSLAWWILTISEWNSVDLCPVIAYCITNNGLPDWVDLFSLNGTIITSGSNHNITIDSNNNTLELEVDWTTVSTAPIINSNDLSNTGLAITSTVNGITDSTDITSDVQALITSNTDSVTNTVVGHLIATHTAVDNTVVNINETITSLWDWTLTGTVVSIPFTNENGTTINSNTDLAWLMNSAVFQSNDDQVLTAGATSDMDVQLVPTTVTDPDSQTDKINYEISVTPKPTVICSGNALSATNKLLTSDTLDLNTTVPTTVLTTPDPITTPYIKAIKVNTGCNEDIYVPQETCADLTDHQEWINNPLPLNSYTNVVQAPVSSLAAAQASVVDKTIIVEVVNPTDPCENGVYAIEPNGDTKKIEHWKITDYTWLWQYNVDDVTDKNNTIAIPNQNNGNILTITPSQTPVAWYNYYRRDFNAWQNTAPFDAPYPACAGKKWIAEITVKWENWLNPTDNTVDFMAWITTYIWINGVFNIFWKWREQDRCTFLANPWNNWWSLQPEFNMIAEMLDTGNIITATYSILSQYNNLWAGSALYNSFNYYFVYLKRELVDI